MKKQTSLSMFFAMLVIASLACSLPGQDSTDALPTYAPTVAKAMSAAPTINIKKGEVAKVGTMQIVVMEWNFSVPNADGIDAEAVILASSTPAPLGATPTYINGIPLGAAHIGARVEESSGVVYEMRNSVVYRTTTLSPSWRDPLGGKGIYFSLLTYERRRIRLTFVNNKFPLNKSAKLKLVFDVKDYGGSTVTVDLGAPGKAAFPAAITPPVILAQGQTKTFGNLKLTLNGLETREVKPTTGMANVLRIPILSMLMVDFTVELAQPDIVPPIRVTPADENWIGLGDEGDGVFNGNTSFTFDANRMFAPLKQRVKVEASVDKEGYTLKRALILTPVGIIGVALP